MCRCKTAAGFAACLSVAAAFFAVQTVFFVPNALAQQGLELVLTPNREASSLQRAGSAISVIDRDTLARTGQGSVADALRQVPGLFVAQMGGPGGQTSVFLRGAASGQTLVLIDGVRVNDPTSPGGAFDFAQIPVGLIERIEILRGPQSALYGSDATGGVINILTRRGTGPATRFMQIEGGRYGTLNASGGVYGRKDGWDYALGIASQNTDGFSRYGYRIKSLERLYGPLDRDGAARQSVHARLGYRAPSGFGVEAGGLLTLSRTQYDYFYGPPPDSASNTRGLMQSTYIKTFYAPPDTPWRHEASVFSGYGVRKDKDYTPDFAGYEYYGQRMGAEYQGRYAFERLGSVIFGLRFEREGSVTYEEYGGAFPVPRTKTIDKTQDTHAAFALWQAPVTERLDVTLGGRLDHVGEQTFPTARATLAYRIEEMGSKWRLSAGSGAKAPTLFQRFGGYEGRTALTPEHSLGADFGLDQSLYGGRVKVSATAFVLRSRDLIGWTGGAACLPTQPFGCYVNIERAQSAGLELEGQAQLIPNRLMLQANYTFLQARNLTTNQPLARRPDHSGRLALDYTVNAQWRFSPSLVLVGERWSSEGGLDRLAPYARLDFAASYAFAPQWEAFARLENLTNARYQEVKDFGTAGRSLYAGLRGQW